MTTYGEFDKHLRARQRAQLWKFVKDSFRYGPSVALEMSRLDAVNEIYDRTKEWAAELHKRNVQSLERDIHSREAELRQHAAELDIDGSRMYIAQAQHQERRHIERMCSEVASGFLSQYGGDQLLAEVVAQRSVEIVLKMRHLVAEAGLGENL